MGIDWYQAEELREFLYRPDIITKVWKGEDISNEEKEINLEMFGNY